MKHIITLILSLCSIVAAAQTVTNPPSGSKPYGTPVATPSGEIMVGRSGSYTYITRKAYTDSLIALGYTKAQVDALLAGYVPTTRTINGKALSANVTLTAGDIGAIPTSEKGAANGVATLDINQKVPMSQIPDALVGSVNYQGNYNAATNTPTLPASPGSDTKGHYYVVSTAGTQFGLDFEAGDWIISNGSEWQKVDNNNSVTSVNGKVGAVNLTASDVGAIAPGDNVSDLNNDAGYITAADIPVTSVNGETGDVSLDANDIGLGNVDNTSDANKPVSTAQQAALDGKEDLSNKVTSLSSPNNTTYPTTLAVQNAIAAAEPNITGSNGIQVDEGEISPVYGTTSGTVAQGNDSRINNGNTAYGWGNYASSGWGNGIEVGSVYSGDVFSLNTSGVFRVSSSSTNLPVNENGYITSLYRSSAYSALDFVSDLTRDRYFTVSVSGVRSPWYKYWHSGNYTPPVMFDRNTNGLVPSPGGSGTTRYLREDGSWVDPSSGGGGGTATDLSIQNRTATTLQIGSSTGSAATVPIATASLGGLMSASDKVKLNAALTDFTEVDPTVPSHVKSITTGNISSWNQKISPSGIFTTVSENSPPSTYANNVYGGVAVGFGSVPGAAIVAGINVSSTGGLQFVANTWDNNVLIRKASSATWTDIGTIWTTSNFNPDSYTIPWARVTSKPSTFTPSPHSHAASDIVSGTLSTARLPSAVAYRNTTNSFTGSNSFSQPVTVANATSSNHAVNLGQLTWNNLTVPDGSISNAKLAPQPGGTVKGRMSSDGTPTNLTMTNLKDMLGIRYTSGTITTPLSMSVGSTHEQSYSITGLNGNEVVSVSPRSANWVAGLIIQARPVAGGIVVSITNNTTTALGAERNITFNAMIFDPDGLN